MQRITRLNIVVTLLIIVSFCSMSAFAASIWQGPAGAPVTVTGLSSVLDDSDLVRTTTLSQQALFGPLTVSKTYEYPVFLSHVTNSRMGVVGIGLGGTAADYVPVEPFAANSNVGIYGYASDADANYGVYGYSASGKAMAGRALNATGYGGYFKGDVRIETNGAALGTLRADTILATGPITADSSGSSVDFAASTAVNMTAIRGYVTGSFPSSIGVYGYSDTNYGLKAAASNETASISVQADDEYAVYGYAASGTGVTGEAGASQTNGQGLFGQGVNYGVYGKSVFTASGFVYVAGAGNGSATSTSSGVGIYACGTQNAGQFNGNVYIGRALGMGVNATQSSLIEDNSGLDRITGTIVRPTRLMTQALLAQIFTKCVQQGSCSFCSIQGNNLICS